MAAYLNNLDTLNSLNGLNGLNNLNNPGQARAVHSSAPPKEEFKQTK